MATIDVSFSFAGSDDSFLESPPVVTRQRSKLEPGAPIRPVRMPSLEEGEIRVCKRGLDADLKLAQAEVKHYWNWDPVQQRFVFEKTEAVVEPMRSMATPADLKLAYAEAAAREFARRCESEVRRNWNWDPVQQRFALV